MAVASPQVAIVGAGIAGLATAWRLRMRGIGVVVLERESEASLCAVASRAAGGMLAPSAEVQFEEMGLYHFAAESLRQWPRFADELERAAGLSVGYHDDGTLLVAVDRDDAEALRRLFRFQQEQGLNVSWLSTGEALDLEPFLSPRIAGAIHSPDDHQVDNRAVVEALIETLAADEAAELRFGSEVGSIESGSDSPTTVLADGTRIQTRVVVLAAGAWARSVAGIDPPIPMRPVKGQILGLRMVPPFGLRHVVRTLRGYLVPKASGTLMVGATAEEMGFDDRVTAGAAYRLLENAVEAVPGVEELELEGVWAGFRPAARDHQPMLGFTNLPGVAVAGGLYRHGILLAPIAAEEVAADVASYLANRTETSSLIAPFSPTRFAPST